MTRLISAVSMFVLPSNAALGLLESVPSSIAKSLGRCGSDCVSCLSCQSAVQSEPTTCRPSRRTAGVPDAPQTNHRSNAEARGDTIRVGTICRVAAT
jgi:hypothetical protein